VWTGNLIVSGIGSLQFSGAGTNAQNGATLTQQSSSSTFGTISVTGGTLTFVSAVVPLAQTLTIQNGPGTIAGTITVTGTTGVLTIGSGITIASGMQILYVF
jgi:hypothetical protein